MVTLAGVEGAWLRARAPLGDDAQQVVDVDHAVDVECRRDSLHHDLLRDFERIIPTHTTPAAGAGTGAPK